MERATTVNDRSWIDRQDDDGETSQSRVDELEQACDVCQAKKTELTDDLWNSELRVKELEDELKEYRRQLDSGQVDSEPFENRSKSESETINLLQEEIEALKRGLDEKENEVDALNYHVEEYKVDRGRMQRQVEEMEKRQWVASPELQSLQSEVERLTAELQSTKIENAELRRTNEAQLDELSTERQEIIGLQSHVHALQTKCDEYEAEIEGVMRQQTSYLENIKQLDNEVLQLRETTDDQSTRAEELKMKNEELKKSMSNLKEENSHVTTEMHKARINQTQVDGKGSDQTNDDRKVTSGDQLALMHRIELLQRENDNLHEKVRRLEATAGNLEIDRTDLQAKVKLFEGHENTVDERVAGLAFANEALKLSEKSKDKQLKHVENELIEKTRELKKQQSDSEMEKSERKSIEQTLAVCKEKLTTSLNTIKQLQAKVRAQEHSMADSTSLEGRAMQRNVELEERQMTLEMELGKMEAMCEQWESECQSLKNQLESKNEAFHKLQLERNDLDDVINGHSQEFQQLTIEVEETRRSIETVKEQLRLSQASADESETRYQETEKELEVVRGEREVLRRKLQELTNSHVEKDIVKRTEALLTEQTAENEYLVGKIKEKDSLVSDLCVKHENVMTLMNTERQEHDKETKSLTTRLQSLTNQLTQLKGEHSRQEEEQRRKMTMLSEMEQDSQRLKDVIERLEFERSTAEEQLHEIKTNCLSLADKVKELDAALQEEQSKGERTKEELSLAKRKVLAIEKQGVRHEERRDELSKELEATRVKWEASVKNNKEQQMKNSLREIYIGELEADRATRLALEKEVDELRGRLTWAETNRAMNETETGKMQQLLTSKEKKITELAMQLKTATQNDCRMREQIAATEANHVAKEVFLRLNQDLRQQIDVVDDMTTENDGLRTQLDQTNEKLAEQQREHASKERIISSMMDELDGCRRIIQNSKHEVEKKTKEITILKKTRDERSEEHETLMSELRQRGQTMTTLESQIELLQKNQTDLEKEIEDDSQMYSRLSMEFNKLKESAAASQQKETEHDKTIGSLRNTIERMKRKQSQLQKDNEDVKESLSEETKAKRTALTNMQDVTSRLETSERELHEMRAEHDDLKRQQADGSQACQTLKAEVETLTMRWNSERDNAEKEKFIVRQHQIESTELQSKVQVLQDETKKRAQNEVIQANNQKILETEVQRKVQHIDQLEEELERRHGRIAQLQTSNDSLKVELKSARSDYNELWLKHDHLMSESESTREELDRTSTELEDLRQCRTCTNEEREQLKNEINLVENKLNALNNALERSRHQREVLLQELTESQEKTAALESDKEDSRQELIRRLVETEQQLSNLHVAHADLKDEHEATLDELKERRSTIERYKATMETKQSSIDEIETRNVSLSKELTMLSKKIKEMKDDTRTKQRHLEEQDIELEERGRQLHETHERLDAAVTNQKDTQKKLQDEIDEKQEYQVRVDHLQLVVDKLERALQSTRSSSIAQQEQEANYKEEIARLTHALSSTESKLNARENEKQEMTTSLDQLAFDYGSLQKVHSKTLDERAQDHSQFRILETRLSSMESTNKTSEERRMEIEAKLRDATATHQSFRDKLAAKEAIIAGLNSQEEKLQGDNALLDKRAKELELTLQDAEKKNGRLVEQVDTLAAELHEVKRQLETYQHKHRLSEKDEKASAESVAMLRRRVARAESDNASYQREIDRLTKKNTALAEHMEEIQERSSSEMSLRHAELIELRAEVDYHREEAKKRAATNTSNAMHHGNNSNEADHESEIQQLRDALKEAKKSEQESKADLLLTRNKLSVYVKERSKWENEFKSVVTEIHREKTRNEAHQRDANTIAARHEKEVNHLKSKLNHLKQETAAAKQFYEQQLTAQRDTNALDIETKRIEIEALKRQLSMRMSSNDETTAGTTGNVVKRRVTSKVTLKTR